MNIRNNSFDLQKAQRFAKHDFSRKGSIDRLIETLIDKINRSTDYFTTSSCSGRLALVDQQHGDKRLCKFYMNAHEPITIDQLIDAVNQSDVEESLILKFEPFILHVQCRSLEAAKNLHTTALESGFRNSGLTLGKNGKVTLAVRSTLSLEMPLGKNQASLINKQYLEFVVESINEKFALNEKLKNDFEQRFSSRFINEAINCDSFEKLSSQNA